ncbi:hypothetical protein BU25DRAFT_464926 [Macroventuria anomochaeta]|uniref:Uncharacterized protein n=1 Tax=Macroventuria anomochaeta TaxID=301207 RepID=A0ACB6SH81_9PLEO|nr:uncharacterized protein BU25DRAFT_464926 [Macroventuria anomochaeta]KAF2633711.1 hypothetical protein BU25DRAFT_464926 [Macroventuria anomochaeta]
MGYGGALALVNGLPFEWTLSSQSSYQMDTWKWPNVAAGKVARVYVEFGIKWFVEDDACEAYYDIAGAPDKFSILGKKPKDYEPTISSTDMATRQSPKGSKVDLGFRHDAAIYCIMATYEAGQWWSNSGSHDAVMGTFSPGTVGAHFANTQTQNLDFKGQLMAGSRYFDLRPLKVGEDDVRVGGNGQSVDDIIKHVNDFTGKFQELVINLSHTLDTDNDYKGLNQGQCNSLFEKLKGINNRYTVDYSGDTGFSAKVLGDFLTDRVSVFVVAQFPSGIKLGDYAKQGFFASNNFPFYDSYSNSNDLTSMKDDQVKRLKDERNIASDPACLKDKIHILSWTPTQQREDVLNLDRAILNPNAAVSDDLVEKAWNAFTPITSRMDKSVVFPFDKSRHVPVNNDIAALAIAVNWRGGIKWLLGGDGW